MDYSFEGDFPLKKKPSKKKLIAFQDDEVFTPSSAIVSSQHLPTNTDEGQNPLKPKKTKQRKEISFDGFEQPGDPKLTSAETESEEFGIFESPPKTQTVVPIPASQHATASTSTFDLSETTVVQTAPKRSRLNTASMFDGTSVSGEVLRGQFWRHQQQLASAHSQHQFRHQPSLCKFQDSRMIESSSKPGTSEEAPPIAFDQPFIPRSHYQQDELGYRPLLDPITIEQLHRPQADYRPTSRYSDDSQPQNADQIQSQRSFNRAYYSMDESGPGGNDFMDDIYRSNGSKLIGNNEQQHQMPLSSGPVLTAAAAQRQERQDKRSKDATGWEDERCANALGLSVIRSLDDLEANSTESTVNLYVEEQIPAFLYQYNKRIVESGTMANKNQGEKIETLSMFKQEKVQVAQKMDGHMMRLAKDGNQSIIEYKNQKDRLKNHDRFWEAKGNAIGAISGQDAMLTPEDRARLDAEHEQQKNEIGGYVGDPAWVQRQLGLDQILYKEEYQKEKEAMLKKLALANGSNSNPSLFKNEPPATSSTLSLDEKNLDKTDCKNEHFSQLMATHACALELVTPTTRLQPTTQLQPTSISHNFRPSSRCDEITNDGIPPLSQTQSPSQPQSLISFSAQNEKPPAANSTLASLPAPTPTPTSFDDDRTLTQQQRSELKRLEIKQVRDNLPAFQSRHEFLQHVLNNQVVIVVGETGSGKTTQLVQYLYESGYTTIPSPPPGYKWTPEQQKLSEDDHDDNNHSNDNGGQNTGRNNPKNGPQKSHLHDSTRYLIRTGHRIVVTQPRRVAATSVATRVAEEMGVDLGTTVGYTIRFEECTSPYTAITFMTDGILLRETLSSPNLDQYSVVIIDEAHERSLSSDILFGLIRTILARRTDLKLIVTSATMNADAFSKFFGGAPIMHIAGRTYPVELNYNASVPSDYIIAAAKRVLQCHLQHVTKSTLEVKDSTTGAMTKIDHLQPTGDILVFMTGQDDVEATCYYIRQELENAGVKMPLWVLPITSTLPQDVQSKIFLPSSIRKCIVATNIAETSLTIDGVRYVIDTGLYKLKTYNAQIGMDMLTVTPISQASANQRKGRAGRTSPGICYRLYRSEEFYDELLANNIAEIHRTNLSNVILTLKAVFHSGSGGSNNIFNFPFLEPPSPTTLLAALHQLYLLGAIDENEQITPIGTLMILLPLDPPLSRLVIESIRLQCLSEVLTLAAMLSVPNIYYRPHGKEEQYQPAHAKFALGEGDFISLVNVYNSWAFYGYREQWCADNYLQFKGLNKAREVRSQLVQLVKSKEFCDKVMICFTTKAQRDEAHRTAQERSLSWNNINRNKGGHAMKRGLFSGQSNSATNIHQHPARQNDSQAPTLNSLYLDSLTAYHTFQELLQNTTHILTSRTTAAQWSAIRKCICAGYFINAAKLLSGVSYQNIRTGIGCEVHSTSSLGTGHDFCIYQDIVITSKNFMRMVSAVEPDWLVEYGAKMYKVQKRRRKFD